MRVTQLPYNNIPKNSFKSSYDSYYYDYNTADSFSLTIKDTMINTALISGIILAGSTLYSNKTSIFSFIKKLGYKLKNKASVLIPTMVQKHKLNKIV